MHGKLPATAAFIFPLAFRLIGHYTVKEDTGKGD
jgi:hypothetical protein